MVAETKKDVFYRDMLVRTQLTLCVFSLETRRAEPLPDDLRQRLTEFQQGKLDHPGACR